MMQSIDPPAGTTYAREVKITDRFIGDHKTFRKMLFELGQIAGEPVGQAEAPRLVRLVELSRISFSYHTWGRYLFSIPLSEPSSPKRLRLFASATWNSSKMSTRPWKATSTTWSCRFAGIRLRPTGRIPTRQVSRYWQSHLKKEEEQLFPLSERILGAGGLEKLSQNLEDNHFKAPPARQHLQVS